MLGFYILYVIAGFMIIWTNVKFVRFVDNRFSPRLSTILVLLAIGSEYGIVLYALGRSST